MVTRPGIARSCQQRICGYTHGPHRGQIVPIGEMGNPWQEMPYGNTKFYYNKETGVSQGNVPRKVYASGDDFFSMREFCSEGCRNLTGNQALSKTTSRTGSMEDAYGEVTQIPGTLGGNPWMPSFNIINELPDIKVDDCLSINVIRKPRWECDPNRVSKCDLNPPVYWKPTSNASFNVHGTEEMGCGEDPRNVGQGVYKVKKILGLTEDKKACRVEYRATKYTCSRDCKIRFMNTEAAEAGQANRDRKKMTWADMDLQNEAGGATTEEWNNFFADIRLTTDLRKTWEIGRPKGIKWGLDWRSGSSLRYTGEGEGELLHPDDYMKLGPEAPYGYKIYAELVKIQYPSLSNGKKCLIEKEGWYRTAKIPITDKDNRDLTKLKREFGFSERGFVKNSEYNKLINEDWDDGRSVLIIPFPNSKEEPRFEKVHSKSA
jgi:hypothetical protein